MALAAELHGMAAPGAAAASRATIGRVESELGGPTAWEVLRSRPRGLVLAVLVVGAVIAGSLRPVPGIRPSPSPRALLTDRACDAFHDATDRGRGDDGAGARRGYALMAKEARAAAEADVDLTSFADAARTIAAASMDPSGTEPEDFGAAAGVVLEECDT